MPSKLGGNNHDMATISTSLSAAAIKAAAGPVANFIKKVGVDQYNKIAATFEGCFQGHVETTEARCSKMKNILYRDQSVDFLSQYVNIQFGVPEGRRLSDVQAVSKAISSTPLLISGTAGAGKTMFMRWSALRLIGGMKSHGRVPLFLEMRYFEEDYHKLPLERYIYDKTSAVDAAANFGQFEYGLKSGLFIILLDAIDEINPAYRENVVSRIMDFARTYPQCGLVISSRYDEKLESIQEFLVLRALPMNRDQIVEVIDKLEYDVDVKSKLTAKLNEGLYDKLEEFLSNPLLATIMLLTFDHSADIPTKLTSFYQQAFEALYQRHDAAKGAYKRAHYAGLPIDKFQDIFSAFSFQTYLDYKFEFTDADLASAMSDACEYNQEEVNPALVLRDSMESVCLIQRDGLYNVFSHRSFQEYFCALFISQYRETDVGQLIGAIASMEHRSNVLRMLYEMAPEVFEYYWVLPLTTRYLEEFGKTRFNTKAGLAKAFSSLCNSLEIGLTSNKPQLIVWPSETPAEKEVTGQWMGIIQSATQNKYPFYNIVFSQPLWSDWDEFVSGLPENVRPSSDYIADNFSGNAGKHEEDTFSISSSDAAWLIYSELPAMFEEIRNAIKRYHTQILERRSGRRATVERLLVKPRPKRFI